ncbi:hypothetical protein ACQPZF_00990 [Actinosynnema sp. CS-041913]|uniref:hypothetical protein n=1 Tax=Actinosynnema sp. CS-041913 TaxID=3239917 RepID=UPI003D8A686F
MGITDRLRAAIADKVDQAKDEWAGWTPPPSRAERAADNAAHEAGTPADPR